MRIESAAAGILDERFERGNAGEQGKDEDAIAVLNLRTAVGNEDVFSAVYGRDEHAFGDIQIGQFFMRDGHVFFRPDFRKVRLPLDELSTLEKLGIKTIGQLGEVPLVELGNQFGPQAAALQKLGRGEDLVPFQAEQTQECRWSLDCTTLEEFMRPLHPQELKPYLQRGMEKLAAALQKQQKTAGELQLEACSAQGLLFKKNRLFKEAADDAESFLRALESLLPEEPLAHIEVVLSRLEFSTAAQLSMFWEPQAPKLFDEELLQYAQAGIELPRRERLLLLWEECFT